MNERGWILWVWIDLDLCVIEINAIGNDTQDNSVSV